jgi:hypothetical protein
MKKKDIHRRKQLSSPNDSDQLCQDSGYNSQSDRESNSAKEVSYWQKIADFAKSGTSMSNHGDSTKAMIDTAEEFWTL